LKRKTAIDALADPGHTKPDVSASAGRRLHTPALYASLRLRNAVKKNG